MQTQLYELRKTSKFTQDEIAKELGITRASYGSKERGVKQFNQDEMFALSNLFRKPINEIFLPRCNRNGNEDKQEV